MKNILYFLGSLLIAVAAAFLANKWLGGFENPGYVLIGIGYWSLETSLIVFTVSLIMGFFCILHFIQVLRLAAQIAGPNQKSRQQHQIQPFSRSADCRSG